MTGLTATNDILFLYIKTQLIQSIFLKILGLSKPVICSKTKPNKANEVYVYLDFKINQPQKNKTFQLKCYGCLNTRCSISFSINLFLIRTPVIFFLNNGNQTCQTSRLLTLKPSVQPPSSFSVTNRTPAHVLSFGPF